MTRIGLLIATVFGTGYAPGAPGTLGAAVGLVWHFATRQMSPSVQLASLLVLVLAGTWAAGVAARHARRDDPSHVVVDEVAGQAITLVLLPVGAIGAVTGFILFRVFDIVKPWPVRQFEQLPGGWGIMADDIMAGVYGWVTLRLLMFWQPGLF
jgi:phosphatidylglycerophosphatase A